MLLHKTDFILCLFRKREKNDCYSSFMVRDYILRIFKFIVFYVVLILNGYIHRKICVVKILLDEKYVVIFQRYFSYT